MPTGVVILIKTKQKLSEGELRELRVRFVADLVLTSEDFFYDLEPLACITNAEMEFIPREDEDRWLNINFHRAYFDPYYKRGDIHLYVRAAEWLEKAIPGCEIYYGHDVSDDYIRLFDKQMRREYLNAASTRQ